MNKLLLIDGNSLTYRAYYGSAYGSQGILKTKNGTPINAVITLNRMLKNAFKQYNPTHVLIAFDAGPKTIRHKKLESYKGGRQKTPDELIVQFPIIKEMIKKMGIIQYELNEIEADDIIASLAVKYSRDNEVIVMSSDKDLYQLVDNNISIAVPQNGSKPNDFVFINNFEERFGYCPNQVKDIKGIVGDPSDNLPGVKGIGIKGAIKLLDKYKTIEGIYENINDISGLIKEKLIESKEMAFLCKDIATLFFDIEIPFSLEEMTYKNEISNELLGFFEKYELNSLLRSHNHTTKKLEKEQKSLEKDIKQLSFDNLLF